MFSLPVWATCTDGNLIKWVPPNGCKNIIIFGDLDASFSGQQASYCLAYRLINIKEKPYNVEVHFTQFSDNGQFHEDFNDALRTGENA